MLQDYKISAFQKTHAMLDDNPSQTLSAAALKAWWDSSPEEVRVSLNGVIDFLVSLSASKGIGSDTIAGITGANVFDQLVNIKALVDANKTIAHDEVSGVVLGQIPDGILGFSKLAPDAQLAYYGGFVNAYKNGGYF